MKPDMTQIVGTKLTNTEGVIVVGMMTLCKEAHRAATKWYLDPVTGEPVERNKGEMIALMHSELSEALEAIRKDLMDDKLTHRKGVEVELADLLIRVADFGGKFNLDLGGAIVEKMRFNAIREDHTLEARRSVGGKAF